PNTPAPQGHPQLPETVNEDRHQELNSLVERTPRPRNERYLGRVEEVLVEGVNPRDGSQVMGRTRTNRLTFFPAANGCGGSHQAGDLVPVRIETARGFSLSGQPLTSGGN
ncbi:MAG: TRAM domain-containing protein, partial [Cyanobacteriota bacterium]